MGVTQMHLDPILSLRPPPARRAERLRPGRLHPDDHLADSFFDLEHPKAGQSQHLLGQPDTVTHRQGPPSSST
jgi:hypothetical protein